ncbi:sensor histidine kinase [Oceanisphaera sp. W20_SRM_FM3]|uniref:sensor histidine kinase n=1 Tax=Oceanisphaera sp. W20_SRM_FM3 TaxID=3240267 RepID=UPI003F971E6B
MRVSLKGRIALIILVATLVTILAVLLTGYHMLVKDTERQLREHQMAVTERAAEQVEHLLTLRLNTLAHISVQLSNGKRLHSAPELNRELARQRRLNGYDMFPDGIVVLDKNAVAQAESLFAAGRVGTNYANLPHIQQVLQSKQLVISQPLIDLVTGQPLISMLQPILSDDGELQGILLGVINLTHASLLPEQSVGQARREGTQFKIIDTHNQLYIYNGEHTEQLTELKPLPKPLVDPLVDAAFSGFTVGIAGQGPKKWVFANTRLDTLGWVFVSAVPYGQAIAPAKAFFLRFAGISLAVGVLLSTLAFWLVWAAIRPLETMTQQIRDMTRQAGDSMPLSETGVSEVASLAQAFNQLTNERKALSEVKDDFVAVISHELRTPLTSINGALKLLGSGLIGPLPEKAAQLAGLALRNGERLQLIINDLLDFSKLSCGKMTLTPISLELGELIAEAITANQVMASQYQVQTRMRVIKPLAACLDPLRVRQILDNLISNAIKFSPLQGRVTVHAERLSSGMLRICVSDQGPGIPADFAPQLFERFVQAEHGTMRASQGTGLGLAICKDLVSLMQGEIGFYNEGGAHVWLELPSTLMPTATNTSLDKEPL